MIRVFGHDFFSINSQQSGFPRLADSSYHGMNKIQNNNFLLALYLDHGPILSIHVTVFSFSPEGCFQRRKENSSETAELWDLLWSVHSGNSVECPPQCGCLRFSSFFPTHTAHRNALDTSAARKKKGLFCAVHCKNPNPRR